MDKVEMPVLLMPAGNDPENLKEGPGFVFFEILSSKNPRPS